MLEEMCHTNIFGSDLLCEILSNINFFISLHADFGGEGAVPL